MVKKNNLSKIPILIGSFIGLIIALFFIFGNKNPNPEWSNFWMLRPLIVVTFSGAMGGLFYELIRPIRNKRGFKKILSYVLSFIILIFGLWIGIILGFSGTMWN